MHPPVAHRVYRASLLFTAAAFAFYLFFQFNKWGPLRNINTFGEDPYDAVGSFAVQAALLVGILSYARALRLLDQPSQMEKLRLILRGDAIVLIAIATALIADAVAAILHPLNLSIWGILLLVELGGMFVLAMLCGITLVVMSRTIHPPQAPLNLTPADAIDDLWTLIRAPVTRSRSHLPDSIVNWVAEFRIDRVFSRIRWIHPRAHPWRFTGAAALLVGAGLFLAQMREGPPPNLQTALLLALIFIGVETAMTLLGFALLGGYLGLRPVLGPN